MSCDIRSILILTDLMTLMTLKMMAIIDKRRVIIMHPSRFARSIRPSRVTCQASHSDDVHYRDHIVSLIG